VKTIGSIYVAAIAAALLAPLGAVHAAPTETVLHSFRGTSGAYPYSGLIFDAAGNLYRTIASVIGRPPSSSLYPSCRISGHDLSRRRCTCE
jgi:hypothetical protein